MTIALFVAMLAMPTILADESGVPSENVPATAPPNVVNPFDDPAPGFSEAGQFVADAEPGEDWFGDPGLSGAAPGDPHSEALDDSASPLLADTGGIDSAENIDIAAKNEDKGKPNPVVMPPNSKPGGLTYGEWNEEWWQWAFSMPIDDNPLYDTADASDGQSGKVLFLGSSFVNEQEPLPGDTATTIVDRDVTISPGTKIFMPAFNVEVSTIEGYGGTEDEMQAQAASFLDFVSEISVEIDGVSVENPKQYISPSPLFPIGPLPENNFLQNLGYDAPEGTEGTAAANGYYMMLPPLSVGTHTIHYTTTVVIPGGNPDGTDWVWTQYVSHDISVEPDKGKSQKN